MVALDTNLLLYDFHPLAPQHRSARAALAAARADGRGWGFTLANAVEFWNLMTRPVAGAVAMATASETLAYLDGLGAAGAQLWHPLHGFGSRLLQSAREERITGRRIFDWQIALTAVENGATEMWTHDRSFRAPSALRLFDPLAG